MKIVFIASHSQKVEFEDDYLRIVNYLKKKYTVTTGNLFEKNFSKSLEQKDREKWYKRSLKNIQSADVVVVEISYPSTANVGHELTYALEIGKPVIALYKKGKDPVFLSGRDDDKLLLSEYTSDDLERVIEMALDYAMSKQDTRFNFFISSEIGTYLDWIAKHRRIPRAVYLRRLIEKDMRDNQEYNQE